MADSDREGDVRAVVVLVTMATSVVIVGFTDWPWYIRSGVSLAVLFIAWLLAALVTGTTPRQFLLTRNRRGNSEK